MADTPRVIPLKPAVERPGGTLPSPCAACPVRDMSICAALTDDEMTELNAILTTVQLGAGDGLIDEGEAATHVYNVTSGALKLYKLLPDGRRQITGFLFPGDFLALSAGETYACSAEAVGPETSVCRFERKRLDAITDRFPQLESRLLQMARTELAEVQEQILLLGRKTAKERLATFLINLARRAERRGEDGNPVEVPMSREDIGDFLGLTTETVSRTFTRLKNADMIAQEPDRRIRIRNREELEGLSIGF